MIQFRIIYYSILAYLQVDQDMVVLYINRVSPKKGDLCSTSKLLLKNK